MSVRVIKKIESKLEKTKEENKERLRVTAYTRVSTNDAEQLSSYESQKQYYAKKIMENEEWEYVGLYADEAISGTQDYKRLEFMRMISDGLNNKFDLILTKSISRFARNTVDTLKYVRKLKEKNVAVLFEEENINTLDMSGELLLTILSSVAQQESETISNHVKLGLKMKKERGELVGCPLCYGYHYDTKTKKYKINKEEAETVKFIFETYLSGKGSNYIAKKLTEIGIKSPKKLDVWGNSSVLGILKNEKYMGDVLQGKTITVDPISHKRVKNRGEEDMYYIENNHEPIVSREEFAKVKEILSGSKNNRRLGNYGKKYTLSSKMKCGFCGGVYGRRTMRTMSELIPIWKCIGCVKYGRDHCTSSKSLRESVIEKAFVEVCSIFCNERSKAMDELVATMKNIVNYDGVSDKLDKIKSQKEGLEYKQSSLLDLLINGTIDSGSFEKKNNALKAKIEKAEKEIEQHRLLLGDTTKINEGIKKVRFMFENKSAFDEFDDEIFLGLIDYVIVGCTDEQGVKNPYIIKFICKKSFLDTPRLTITKERIFKNSNLSTSDNLVILDFISKQKIYSFETINGRNRRETINGLRVIVEIENDIE